MRTWMLAPVIATTLFAGYARAEATDHDKAVASFDEALKLIDTGNCESAIAKLEQSIRYEPSVGARFSLADCYEPRDPLAAWNQLREAERLAYLKHDERQKIAQERAAALEPKLAIVRVVVPNAVLHEPSLEMRVDGELVDRFFYSDGTLALKAGPHFVEALVPHRKWSREVVAQPGTPASVTVRLETECPAPPPPAQPPPVVVEAPRNPGGTQRALAFVFGGIGLAGIASGAALGLVSLTKKNDIDSACGGSSATCNATPGSLDAQRAEQQSFGQLSTIAFVAGGAALVGAAALYFTAPHASAPRVGVSAGASRDSAALMLSGKW